MRPSRSGSRSAIDSTIQASVTITSIDVHGDVNWSVVGANPSAWLLITSDTDDYTLGNIINVAAGSDRSVSADGTEGEWCFIAGSADGSTPSSPISPGVFAA
jgi:hypothetical protein